MHARTTPAEAPRCVWADLSGLCVADEKKLGDALKNGQLPEVIPGGIIVSNLKHALAHAENYDRILYGTTLARMERYRWFIERIGRTGIPAIDELLSGETRSG